MKKKILQLVTFIIYVNRVNRYKIHQFNYLNWIVMYTHLMPEAEKEIKEKWCSGIDVMGYTYWMSEYNYSSKFYLEYEIKEKKNSY